MATPLTPDRLVTALRAEGVKVLERPFWRTNHRNHKGAWGPVHGVMLHHTVTAPGSDAVGLCFRGSTELPGPLCHGVIERDGTVHLVGNGRANHAGGGDPSVLQAVIDERYGDKPPAPHQHQGSRGSVDGNRSFYGFECANLGDGKDPWPDTQVEAMVRASTAIARTHGWTAKSVIGHLEWSDWKSDPKGTNVGMASLRARIQARLDRTPSWNPGTPTPPRADVTLTSDDLERIALAVQGYRNERDNKESMANTGRPSLDAWGYLVHTHNMIQTLTSELKTLRDEVRRLQDRSE